MIKFMNKLSRFVFGLLFTTILTLIFMSCATNKSSKTSRELVFYPPPPDTARVQFLTTISKSSDITGESSTLSNFLEGKDLRTEITKPFGICAIKNRIFIVDTKAIGMHIIDLKNKTFKSVNPIGQGFLSSPLNCFADTSGNLYVSDQARKEIIVYNYDLDYKASFGSKIFDKPTDVCSYNDRIYVADMKGNKIFVFSKKDYKLISSFPDVPEKDTAFLHQPIHLAVNNDTVYVTDFGEFNIKKFDLKGNFIGTVGSYGDLPGQFSRPKGIAVDKDNYLYVVDAAFQNIQIFNGSSQLMLNFPGEKVADGFLSMPIRVTLDYDNLDFFKQYVDSKYNLKYLIYVTNQFGEEKVTVYGFIELK